MILELINNKRIFLESNKTIELFDEDIILNNKGQICSVKALNFEFMETNNINTFLQPIICSHFNCKTYEVICTGMSIEEATFRIRFSPQKELGIVVVTYSNAIKNMRYVYDDLNTVEIKNKNQIGFYHRLCDSEYFFRWDEDFL